MPDMQVLVYEDGRERLFGPLTLLRPSFDLRCGALLLREKLELRRPGWRCLLLPRVGLAEIVEEAYPGRGVDTLEDGPTLLLSGRVVVDDALLAAVDRVSGEAVLTSPEGAVGAVLAGSVRERVAAFVDSDRNPSSLDVGAEVDVPARVVGYPWELVGLASAEIAADAAVLGRLGRHEAAVHSGAHLVEPARIALGAGCEVGPGAVLDARRGEILIGRDTVIMPNASVAGPVAIGDHCLVKTGANVYGGAAIGPECKIGGEIEGSILQSHSNKQHAGFLGHSYVGSWVNLGAGTDVSDLKNNYDSVRVELDGDVVDTGSIFVGATIGDHSKTAIGTKLNTGTVIGVFSSIVCAGFPPKSTPSFSWGTADRLVEYDLEKALDTARRVMARRDVELSGALESLVRRVFAATRAERKEMPPA